MIALVDLGMGNLRSVHRALEAAGAHDVVLSRDASEITRADRVVVPGQGAFGDCASAIANDGGAIASALREAIQRGTPYLGICLGMQALFDTSEEAPGCAGLGLFRGTVRRLREGLAEPSGAAAKVPHMGWNRIECAARTNAGPRLPDGEWFYFVHSYACVPDEHALVAAECEHGERFVAAIARDNVLAVQFHPEKSQAAGIGLLARWLRSS
jgi:glutamine amidotransferase